MDLQRGVMKTHDEDTKRFFKDSSVICLLSPRYPSNKLGIVKQKASDFGLSAATSALCIVLVPLLQDAANARRN